jgi:hypothetical protein
MSIYCSRQILHHQTLVPYLHNISFEKNARILLVILFPSDTAAVTTLDSRNFLAFNNGMCEA